MGGDLSLQELSQGSQSYGGLSGGLNQGFQTAISSVRFSLTTGQLTEALAEAQKDFKTITKNKLNPHTSSKYADLQEIVDATQPALAAQGLVIFQAPIVRDRTAGTLSRLSHKSGEFIENELLLPTSMPGKPDKFDAHSIASAITYSKRYSYTGLIGAVAEDDDDGNAAVENVKPKYKPAPKPEYSIFESSFVNPETEQFSENYPQTATGAKVNPGVPKAIIPKDLLPDNPGDFPTKEERKTFVNRASYYMKTLLPKAGVENAEEVFKKFAVKFTGIENSKEWTRENWNKLLTALDAAKETGTLVELVTL